MKVKKKLIVAFLISTVALFSVFLQPAFASANKEVVEEYLLTPNVSKMIKIESAPKEVKWTTSKKSVVTILGTRGENKSTVTIKTGDKPGTCIVKAKTGDKEYRFRVTVKDDDKVSRVKHVKTTQTKKAVRVKLKLVNNSSKKDAYYGEPFHLERFQDGKWVEVEMKEPVVFKAVLYIIPPQKSANKTYYLTNYYDRAELTKGTYRLCTNTFFKKAHRYAIFSIK